MIDIHCHLLPGLDDGASSIEEAVDMARTAVAEGIHTAIVTPHHANGRYDNEADAVLSGLSALASILNEKHIPLTLLAGQEIRLYSELISDLEQGRLLTLHRSRYLLIECSAHQIPDEFYDLVHELKVLGLTPVLAHPERNRELAKDPDKLYDLVSIGVLSQITSHSLTGLFGPGVQKLALNFCKRNLAHFIASDAHNAGVRPFALNDAYRIIKQKVGSSYEEGYIRNAEALVADEPIPFKEGPVKLRRWWTFTKNR
ncbi:tyrosine-protein phosphatase [Paenibacillus senegalensis]|uniref:tyrosine-protein phosphatase n=1 Tax=Paenibacillus senegalensis TaxID=1465766 RepID=UPI00028A2CDF|nr:CpsB/CapC family capsule biosynthesis tyrosine phosphatase [Paenibacillus senegalensis]